MSGHGAAGGRRPPESATNRSRGSFLFSLDTELAWGYFDRATPAHFTADGQRERWAVSRLLDILNEYGIAATWAVVGHLWGHDCVAHPECPVHQWKGRYPSYEMIHGRRHPLWYGRDVIAMIRERAPHHEIACHSFTHRIFDEGTLAPDEAQAEIDQWLQAARREGITPTSVIFPRNRIGYLPLFKAAGFVAYRGERVMPPVYRVPLLGKVLNRVDLKLEIFTAQGYQPEIDESGLVNLPSSQWLFRINRRVERGLDRAGLPLLRLHKMVRAVRRAAARGQTIHFWAHPHEFRTEADLAKLRYLLDAVAHEIEAGRIESVTMAERARRVLAARRAPAASQAVAAANPATGE
jgi:peptidoglycan/xylan/chitin deacetylase (PgdA/CDA1 family)